MSTGLKANLDGSAAIQVGGSDAIKIDTNLVSTGQFTSNIQPIAATVAANALTITLSPTSLAFRSATLGDGTIYNRQISSAITLTISSGSTLGTVSAQQSRIVVLAIDNAGTIELAAVNISGGNQLDETNLISTTAEGGAGAADSANVIYSTTARTNVAYRVVGFVQSTQATAGTWATAPSTIQGVGGQALASMSSLGYGQVWASQTRTSGTTYYNTTGKPIIGSYGTTGSGTATNIQANINGTGAFIIAQCNLPSGVAVTYGNVVIPPGASYVITVSSGTLNTAYELR